MQLVQKCISDGYEINPNFSILESGARLTQIESRGWIECGMNVWLVEADPKDFASVKEKGYNVLHYALTDRVGKTEFQISLYTGWSYTTDAVINDAIKENAVNGEVVEVPCTTFEMIQKETNTIFDIMIMDIEGCEDIVLKDMKRLDKETLPKILCIECGYEWEKRKKLVLDLGYELDFYFHNNAYFSIPNTVKKKDHNIRNMNSQWPRFEWRDCLVYENENYDTNIQT